MTLSIAQENRLDRLAREHDSGDEDEPKVVRLHVRGRDVDVILRRPDGREQPLFPSGRLGQPREPIRS